MKASTEGDVKAGGEIDITLQLMADLLIVFICHHPVPYEAGKSICALFESSRLLC